MAEKPKVTIGITVVEDGKETDYEYHLNEELAKHFVQGNPITVDLGI